MIKGYKLGTHSWVATNIIDKCWMSIKQESNP
jgi:hypothetical protein